MVFVADFVGDQSPKCEVRELLTTATAEQQMRRGTPRRRRSRGEEELVCHGDAHCQPGTHVRLAWECEDVEKYPCLAPFHGEIGELLKPVGTGAMLRRMRRAWVWLVFLGN